MSPQEYRETIAALGLSQRGASRLLGVNEKTSRDWADRRMTGPPEPVARFLRYMRGANVTPQTFAEIVEAVAPLPQPQRQD
jgi:DNA-binding transcriptional regulator YiaG